MANKITHTIKITTILYGENEIEPQPITLPGTLSDDAMWKAVKKVGGPQAVVWGYHYNKGKYSMDIDTFVNNAVKEEE